MLAETVKRASLSHGNKSVSYMDWKATQQEEAIGPKATQKAKLRFANADKDLDFWRHVLWFGT